MLRGMESNDARINYIYAKNLKEIEEKQDGIGC